ncbi:glucuronate isomerase [Paraglaciecola aquimarina]|uniref:Uronate isomerase n=1 Tax=Paraglaciecola aquimarina TaxID=1235557 RepID=A0ABU3SZE9_9ALTE|nr:glucuronate isomerase [Paraglaciecola aquimarina]MDU0355383.1 glucuronate isomerase [Paraglaciecola aquimarina]
MNTKHTPYNLHPDRLFSSDTKEREISKLLYNSVKSLPIVSPHGHTDPRWFADNDNFSNATELLIIPDHYVFRMLYSQGIGLEQLGIRRVDGSSAEVDFLQVWKVFAQHYYLFHGTPSRIWMDYVFCEVFGFSVELNAENAEFFYHKINAALATDAFRPRALLQQFNIELLATTEGATNCLTHHKKIKQDGLNNTVITTFRPDDVIDPQVKGFSRNIEVLGELTNEDTHNWQGYLHALRQRREFFRAHGATATDHGHATALTADLSSLECQRLFEKIISKTASSEEQELFRAQMLTEMAGMSLEDGMVLQLHPGVHRNHNTSVFQTFGADKGCDIPVNIEYVNSLKPLLSKYGNETKLRFILFTLDESNYTRELAPLAGHYPCLKLGPAWWFNDSPEGMLRFRHQVTETAGFYNTVGFNDDTRAFLSIPARHDVARRIDCRFLAKLVAEHRLSETAAFELARDLSYRLAKEAYQAADF